MKYLFLLVLVASAQAQEPVLYQQRDAMRNVVTSDLVHNNIDFLYFAIAEKADLEPAFCMIGKAGGRADTTRIDLLIPAWIDSSSGSNATYQPNKCTMPGVIGTMHFHPGIGFCKISNDDIFDAHSLLWPVTAIVCIEKKDGRPKLVVVHREVFDEEWNKLSTGRAVARDTSGFKAVYRYRQP